MEASKYAAHFKKFKYVGVTEMKYWDWQKMNMENLKEQYYHGHQMPR